MRGLTLVVAGSDQTRFRTALGLAAAAAALDQRVRLFLDAPAVALVVSEGMPPVALPPPGQPDTGELLETCLALGVGIILCQTGVADAGMTMAALDERFEAGGMTSLLGSLDEDRLLLV